MRWVRLQAFVAFVAFSALAGVVATVGVTPVLAATAVGSSSAMQLFDDLPEYIELGELQQRNVLTGISGGQRVPFATLYNENRVEVSADQVSDALKHAAVDGEDRRFYEHGGVDLQSLARAAVGSAQTGEPGSDGGGSTLTMQLVRNIRILQAQQLPDEDERTEAVQAASETSMARKLQEIKYAIGVEKRYSKEQILLAYLNIAYFGDQVYGVEAAAQRYFGKSAAQLGVAEAASLIAIVQYPESRNLSRSENHAANTARRDVIISAMEDAGHVSAAGAASAIETAVADLITLTPSNQGCAASAVPAAAYFCDFVKRSIPEIALFGTTAEDRAQNWKNGGYQVDTTIDLDLTAAAAKQLAAYAPGSEARFTLGAVADTVEVGTGRVVVMAQNTVFSEAPTQTPGVTAVNLSTDGRRGGSRGFQAASTYKPFTLLEWLENGGSIDDVIDSTPRRFSPMTANGQFVAGYSPRNDGNAQTGRITVRDATARSVNTAYMAMAQQLDLAGIGEMAQRFGVHRADGTELQYVNPSSVLGTNEIAPLTLAAAYAGIANEGAYCSPILIDKVLDDDGRDLGGQQPDCRQAVAPAVAKEAATAMQGLWTAGTAAGALPSDGYPEIGKTGTSNDWDQTWIAGSTTRISTSIWQGVYDGPKQRLIDYSSPLIPGSTSYATNRRALFKAVQGINNQVMPPLEASF